jgi:hypothetical membrane protein
MPRRMFPYTVVRPKINKLPVTRGIRAARLANANMVTGGSAPGALRSPQLEFTLPCSEKPCADRTKEAKLADLHHSGRGFSTIMGSVFWIAGLEWFVAQGVAQAAWTTPYSLSSNFISDLGAVNCRSDPGLGYVCSPLHVLMNYSFMLVGICMVAGVVLLVHHWPRNKATMLGLLLLVLFGVGKVIVGLAPEDQRLFLHAIGSLGILFGNVGCLVFAAGLWRTARPLALIFLCVGAVGVVGFIFLLFPPLTTIRGALERLADWPLPLWLAVLGIRFLLAPSRSPG